MYTSWLLLCNHKRKKLDENRPKANIIRNSMVTTYDASYPSFLIWDFQISFNENALILLLPQKKIF